MSSDPCLRGFEHGVEVPFQELVVRPVGLAVWERDLLPGFGVELLPVAELVAQPRADLQPTGRPATLENTPGNRRIV